MRTLLIDADSLVYQAARAVEEPVQWTPTLWTLHAHSDEAQLKFDAEVNRLKVRLEADEVVMALSDYNKPWRRDIMPTYKANRKEIRKPVVYQPLRDYVHEVYNTFQRPGLEGDDVLGILLTNPAIIKGEKICVSLDKDMKTLPGKHYNMLKDEEFEIRDDVADYWHLKQTLTGDTTDGYKGCPGVGPVAADKILMNLSLWGETNADFNVGHAWPLVVKAYVKAGFNEEEALRNARVARILRHGEYNYTKKEVVLWSPPTGSSTTNGK